MTKTNTGAFTQTILNPGNTFIDTDGTTRKVIATAGPDDARIYLITLSSTDTAANNAFFYINDGSTSRLIAWCPVLANAGTDASTNAIPALASTNWLHRRVDANNNPFFQLQKLYTLEMSLQNPVGATFQVDCIVEQEGYEAS